MIGTRTSIARLTAVPIAPDELSMFSSDEESLVQKQYSAFGSEHRASLRLTALISVSASLMRVMAGSDRQRTPRRKREANVHTCLLEALLIARRIDCVVPEIKFQQFSRCGTAVNDGAKHRPRATVVCRTSK